MTPPPDIRPGAEEWLGMPVYVRPRDDAEARPHRGWTIARWVAEGLCALLFGAIVVVALVIL